MAQYWIGIMTCVEHHHENMTLLIKQHPLTEFGGVVSNGGL
jgi:hypothetical protein